MKKGSRSCLFAAIALISLCIIGMVAMVTFHLCPPTGPWPLPPWCEGGIKIPIPGFIAPLATHAVKPSATVSTMTDGKESFGFFPSSCSLIPDAKKKKFCEDWLIGKEDWKTPDCVSWGRDPAGPQAGRKLCESGTIQSYLPSEVDIYGRGPLWRPEDIDFTPTIIGWGVELGADEPYLGYLTGPKKAGARHISTVSIWNKDSWKKLEDLPPELKDAYITGFDGEALYIQEDVFLNFLDPAFQEWLKSKMKLHIDAGTDGFVFDEHWGTSQAVGEGRGPFDKYSLAGFREYLARKYSVEELQALGIQDIASFNYLDFLVKNNYRTRYQAFGQTGQNPAPFQKDYKRFLLESSSRIINELIDYASTYASQKGKVLKFALNGSPLHGTEVFDFYNRLNLFIFEHEWFPQWRLQPGNAAFDAGVPVTAKMKYAQTLGKPAVTMPYGGGDSKWFQQASVKSGSAIMLHQFAESYANLGYYQYFDLDYIGFKFTPDHTSFKAYFSFIRAHPDAFSNLSSYADVALLRQSRVFQEDQGGLDGIEGFSHVLGEANIPYDVVGIDRIGNYRTVLTGGVQWSDDDVDQMLAFVKKGGTLIATDSRFASNDENNHAVNRPSLGPFKTDGTHALGSGKFVFFSDSLWWKIWTQKDKAASAKILNTVKGIANANTAPEKVQLLPYVDTTGRLVVHILNYDFANGDFTPKENFEVKIYLPTGYSAAGKNLTLSSPDFTGNKTLPFKQEGNVLTFTVPSLYIWDVVVLK
jgi:hypothetical protein